MGIEAGKLRHRVALQRQVRTQDSTTGLITTAWQTQAMVWAAVEALSAREFIQSAAMQSQVTARITIRYRDDIDATWRVVHRGRVYNVHGVLPDADSGMEYITLPVSQGVNDGQ